MNDDSVELRFIARQQQQIINELASLRADNRARDAAAQRLESVVVAAPQRIETAVTSMQTQELLIGQQLTAMHDYSRTLGERLRQIEELLSARQP
jgi:hypothetical protein